MAFEGFDPSDKLMLVRFLVKERTKGSIFGRWFVDADRLDAATLMGCPEATVVTIVESYYVRREQGASAASSLSAIEDFRSGTVRGTQRAGSDLETFVRYRVRLEQQSGKRLSDADISRACFLSTALAEKYISAQKERVSPPTKPEEHIADFRFICELPHREHNRPLGTFKSDQLLMVYYEHPKSIGAVEAGLEEPYQYPQVVLVSGEERPLLIIRSEQNASGSRFLCSLDARGSHTNWGEVAAMSRNDFVKRAGELILLIKYGDTDVGETSLDTLDGRSRA